METDITKMYLDLISDSNHFLQTDTVQCLSAILIEYPYHTGLGFGLGKTSFSRTAGKTGKYRKIMGNTDKYRKKLGICFVEWYCYNFMVIRDVLHAFCFSVRVLKWNRLFIIVQFQHLLYPKLFRTIEDFNVS